MTEPRHLLRAGGHCRRQDHDVPDRYPASTRTSGEIFSLATLQAGGVFYGGLIAALDRGLVYMREDKLPALPTADVFAPGIALGHGIGRLGCFAAGCCWGVPTHLPWAVTFTNPEAQETGRRAAGRAAASDAAVRSVRGVRRSSRILYWRIRKPHATGAIISLYLVLYSTVALHGGVLPLSRTGQSLGRPARLRRSGSRCCW